MFPNFLIYSYLFGINSPSYCLDSVTVPLLSCRIWEQRGSFWAVQPGRALSLVKPHFLSLPRSAPAAAPGNHTTSSEQEAQGQLLILKTVLICLCLISLMLMLAAPSLLTKLSNFLFGLSLQLIRSKDEAHSSSNLPLMTLVLCVHSPRTFIHFWACSN